MVERNIETLSSTTDIIENVLAQFDNDESCVKVELPSEFLKYTKRVNKISSLRRGLKIRGIYVRIGYLKDEKNGICILNVTRKDIEQD